MSDDFSKMMTPLDQKVSSQSLQLTKLLIPFLPPKTQRMLAIYVKFIEFQNTLSHFVTFKQKNNSPEDIFDTLKSHLPNETTEQLDTILNLIQMMSLFQTMQQSSGSNDNFNPMSMFSNILTPEQQDMFSSYSNLFTQETNINVMKEGNEYDGLA